MTDDEKAALRALIREELGPIVWRTMALEDTDRKHSGTDDELAKRVADLETTVKRAVVPRAMNAAQAAAAGQEAAEATALLAAASHAKAETIVATTQTIKEEARAASRWTKVGPIVTAVIQAIAMGLFYALQAASPRK